MEAFEPLINLLVLMSTLSVAAERLANAVKLRTRGKVDTRNHERRVGVLALGVSVLLAVAVRADFFQIIGHLNAPWETLGWAGRAGQTVRTVETVQTVLGMVVTGIALGFGSKFWHDVLDAVYGLRRSIRTGRRADGQAGG